MRKILLMLALAATVGVAQAQEENITATLTEAGTLANYLPKDTADLEEVRSLKIIGPINSTDIGYIRFMAGNGTNGYETDGSLRTLDLSEAKIVRGGNPYWTNPGNANETSAIYINNTIGWDMFRECNALRKVILPEGITKINPGAFEQCMKLREINIPSTVKVIDGAFYYCTNLQSIEIPEGVTEIGDFAFSHCTSLSEIKLPKSLKTLGDCAFNASGIKTMVIPEGITTIGQTDFADCTAMSTIVLPSTITRIKDFAFIRDSTMQAMYCFAKTAPTPGDEAFSFYNKDNSKKATLYVPAGCAGAYNLVSTYKTHFNIVEMPADETYEHVTGIKNITLPAIKAAKNSDAIYNLAGQRVGNDYKGIVIINGKKVLRK